MNCQVWKLDAVKLLYIGDVGVYHNSLLTYYYNLIFSPWFVANAFKAAVIVMMLIKKKENKQGPQAKTIGSIIFEKRISKLRKT